jgi:hypothetical protein
LQQLQRKKKRHEKETEKKRKGLKKEKRSEMSYITISGFMTPPLYLSLSLTFTVCVNPTHRVTGRSTCGTITAAWTI